MGADEHCGGSDRLIANQMHPEGENGHKYKKREKGGGRAREERREENGGKKKDRGGRRGERGREEERVLLGLNLIKVLRCCPCRIEQQPI